MKITFFLPGATASISGGYSVIYKYANCLSARGHKIRILYGNRNLRGAGILHRYFLIRKLMIYVLFGKRPRWYKLDKKIAVSYLKEELSDSDVSNGEIVIATAVDTAEQVARLKINRKFYLVQDFENWAVGDDYVIYTYNLGLKVITVSTYLKNIVKKYSDSHVSIIPNGIDTEYFRLIKPIENRNSLNISMLYHRLENKGSKYGIEAIVLLKNKYPDLKATLFGTVKKPKNLPEWIEYIYCASKMELNSIYNDSAIFICPTIWEGFGLTVLEAMVCGCAVVSTDYEAGRDFLIDMENALICNAKDSIGIYQNACKVIDNYELRMELAENAVLTAERYTWDRSVEIIEKELNV